MPLSAQCQHEKNKSNVVDSRKSIFDKNFTGITVGEAVAGFESSSANCSGYVETIAVGQSADTVDL